jgi:branched-chain amino acid transport system ATP-binding protein
MRSVLSVVNMQAYYGDFQALFGVDFKLDENEIVAIIGANGAGKSTFLKSICGELTALPNTVQFAGESLAGLPANEIVRKGIAMVPEGRRLFPSLTIEENLLSGQFAARSGKWNLKRVYALFPMLEERKKHKPGTLSGGQQQMTAIGRALLSNPKVLLCDEVSLGLAPIIVKTIYESLPVIRGEGTSVVLVEQDINTALKAADRVYCFTHGRVSLQGPSKSVTNAQVSAAYFGV